jgi:hypothetical protein
MIENSPVGVGVAGAPTTTWTRRTICPPRYNDSVRPAVDTTIRQTVVRRTTWPASSQPVASFGLQGSRTSTQHTPLRERAAPNTSSHDACSGPTERQGRAPARATPL